ncbi:MAG: hypothetical protein JNJ57_10145 [Saprospiraceae bacterium]|nr:hypothetical protein [Saprospiraceae bacterium]
MNKTFFQWLPLFAFVVLGMSACDKTETIDGLGDVVIEMDNRAGDDELVFGTKYVTANGDTIQFSTFNYFVSNFVLVNEDGSEYTVPKEDCYFLCKHEDADSRELTLRNVPAGNYKSVKFTIGVDSLKSVSPAAERTGVLDPTGGAAGMYWSWNAGYIFVKVEGTSPQAPIDVNTNERTLQYHTGLFGGKDSPTLNNLKKVTINTTSETAHVRKSHEAPVFHLYVDVLEMFTSPTNINVALNPTSHAGPYSATVANNYADMFTLDHVHNHD